MTDHTNTLSILKLFSMRYALRYSPDELAPKAANTYSEKSNPTLIHTADSTAARRVDMTEALR
jgi:hypothetical protein